jgi:DNA-binding NtrC family response regulator
MRILIADDDPGTLFALKASLVSNGHQIITASNGDQAIKFIKEEKEKGRALDIIITDLRMPGLNGLDLIQSAGSIFPSISTVLMTAHGDTDVEKTVMSIEGCTYLEKPFGSETIQRLIKRITNGRRINNGKERK